MATNWSGKLFVVNLGNGKYSVGFTIPTGLLRGSQVSVYDGTGPFPPTGFPQGKEVDDPGAWMASLKQQGFNFTPSTP